MIVVFAGTSDFAVPSLAALLAAGVRVPRVYTQPDRPAGRGRLPRASPVKVCGLAHGIEIRQPLRADGIIDELRALTPDLMVVAAYGLLLPPAVLRIPTRGCVNVHASLLPRWRGAAPVARAIEAGDDVTGVSLMQMDAGLDTGAILAQQSTAIGPRETAGELHDRLAALGAALLGEQLNAIGRGELAARPQATHGVSYAAKLRKAEARLDWRLDADLLARRIRAFNPWPVAWTAWQGEPLRIWQATAVPAGTGATAGEIVAAGRDGLRVACGDGALDLITVQRRGGRPLPVADFLNGAELGAGMHFQ